MLELRRYIFRAQRQHFDRNGTVVHCRRTVDRTVRARAKALT